MKKMVGRASNSLDTTRLVISNDGWELTKSDICAIHNYSHGGQEETEKYEYYKQSLASKEQILHSQSAKRRIYANGFAHQGEPILLTEFGGIAYTDEKELIKTMQKGFQTIKTVTADQIHVRDPFVFPCEKERKYYLFGTTFADGCGNVDPVFEVYESGDLLQWTGPYVAFQPPKGFWGVRHYWAPEVFAVDGKYYMFASCKGGIGEHRGTGILVADHPAGPYQPHSDGPVTPSDWECLDGTYYEDGEGQRWIVFCHEWTELHEGKIKAIRLSKDLKSSYGEVVTILNAADMEWIRLFGDPRIEKQGYLTDAPFMYNARNGDLIMLWSSYSVADYGDEEAAVDGSQCRPLQSIPRFYEPAMDLHALPGYAARQRKSIVREGRGARERIEADGIIHGNPLTIRHGIPGSQVQAATKERTSSSLL